MANGKKSSYGIVIILLIVAVFGGFNYWMKKELSKIENKQSASESHLESKPIVDPNIKVTTPPASIAKRRPVEPVSKEKPTVVYESPTTNSLMAN